MWNSTWCRSNKQLRAKPEEKFSSAEHSMLVCGNLGLNCSWLSFFSPSRVMLPFVLGLHGVNIYTCMYKHTDIWNEWSLKELGWAINCSQLIPQLFAKAIPEPIYLRNVWRCTYHLASGFCFLSGFTQVQPLVCFLWVKFTGKRLD